MMRGFRRPIRSTGRQRIPEVRPTDELDEDPYDNDLPCTRNTVDQQSGVAAETEVLVDGRTKVVAGRQQACR